MIAAETVERRVLDGVRDALLDRALIEEAMRAYGEELASQRANAIRRRAKLESELTEIEGRLNRQLDLYETNVISKEKLRERIDGLEAREAAIKALASDYPRLLVRAARSRSWRAWRARMA